MSQKLSDWLDNELEQIDITIAGQLQQKKAIETNIEKLRVARKNVEEMIEVVKNGL